MTREASRPDDRALPEVMQPIRCAGCGGFFPDVEGPTHRYLTSAPGCWAAYGRVLAREYEDTEYFRVHRLTVDAYAAQHPGSPSPQTIQSIHLHLVSLCLVLEEGVCAAEATRVLARGTRLKSELRWLEPPPTRGAVTVAEVARATSAASHASAVRGWAESVWTAWHEHHPAIRALQTKLRSG